MERLLFPLRANRREIINGESLGRLLSPALSDDLPRPIDDAAAIFSAARNSPQRYLQCGTSSESKAAGHTRHATKCEG